LYYIGLSLLYKKDYRTALKYFKKCEEASSFVDDDPSGFRVNANLYLGKIYDKLGKRKYAKRKYEKVLDWDDYKGSHNAAEKYLKKAFGK
jgi:tetratricopeptide (TPR) repeat protein